MQSVADSLHSLLACQEFAGLHCRVAWMTCSMVCMSLTLYKHRCKYQVAVQLVFEEEAESSLGPFSSTAKLTSVGGTIFYASGKGRVSAR